jgi:hypothetical protein
MRGRGRCLVLYKVRCSEAREVRILDLAVVRKLKLT